jgi:CBS domain containing-hemolysin-like protein
MDLVLLVVAALLVPVAGSVSCLDSALGRVSVARVDELAKEHRRGAVTLAEVLADRARYTNLLLLLRVVAELTATVFVTIVFRSELGANGATIILVVAAMTIVSYVLVGVGPRTLGRQHPYRVALAGSWTVRLLGRVFNPLASLLILIGNAITPGKGFREGPFSSETELRELVDMAEARGVVESEERNMIQSVFSLGDTIAREVMVPRTDVVWLESDKTVSQALALALRSGFSRIPVVGENVDDVVGVIYLKDLVRRAQDVERAKTTTLAEVMRPASFVPESKPVDVLLREMQLRRTHISIVIDEYGGTAGLLTIEDILEEIVGEITDEYDVERAPIEWIDDTTARVIARLAVEDLAELFKVDLPTGDEIETVGGLLAQKLGRVAIPGSKAVIGGLQLVAESVGGRRNRVDTVLVCKVEEVDPRTEKADKDRSDKAEKADRDRSDRIEPSDVGVTA